MLALVCLYDSPQNKIPIIITKVQKKLGFFLNLKKDLIKEIIQFITRESSKKLPYQKRFIITHENKKILCWKEKNPNFIYYAFCNKNYNEPIGFKCILQFEDIIMSYYKKKDFFFLQSEIDLNINIPEVKNLFKKFEKTEDKLKETHEKVDKLNDEIRMTFVKLIDADDDINILVEKSKVLNEKAKKLLKNSKKMNSKCCY